MGRPHVADGARGRGHARDQDDAFDRLIGRGRPAFVPRSGATPDEVIAVIREAGGIASFAHPGVTKIADDRCRS